MSKELGDNKQLPQDNLCPMARVMLRLLALVQEELEITDKLLKERLPVMEAIPPCPVHGHQCVPHALGWIEKQKGNPRLEELNAWLLGR